MKYKSLWLFPIVLSISFMVASVQYCGESTPEMEEQGELEMGKQSIKEVIETHRDEFMVREGVEGIGQGKTDSGDPCVVIFLSQSAEQLESPLPDSLEGYPVELKLTGRFEAGSGSLE